MFTLRQSHSVFCYQRHSVAAYVSILLSPPPNPLFLLLLLFCFSILSSCEYTAPNIHKAPQKKTHYFQRCICVSTMSDLCMRCVFFYSLTIMFWGRKGVVGHVLRAERLAWTKNNTKYLLSCVPGFSARLSLEFHKFFFFFFWQQKVVLLEWRGDAWSDCPLFNYLGYVIKKNIKKKTRRERGECVSSASHIARMFLGGGVLFCVLNLL